MSFLKAEKEPVMEANRPTSVKWDDYFPLINKAILGLLFVVTIMIATGVDLVQLGGKVLGGGGDVEAVVAAELGEPVASDFGGAASRPATGLAAWRNVIVAITGMLGVVVLVFYILSVGGRDAERMKEQQVACKKKEQPVLPDAEHTPQATPVLEECNLSSYKMFYASECAISDQS